MIWNLIGRPAWVALAVSFISIAAAFGFGSIMVKRNDLKLEAYKSRIGIMQDFLSSFKAVKYLMKEGLFADKIAKIRETEIHHFKLFIVVDVLGMAFTSISSPVMTIAIPALYAASGMALEPRIVFPMILYVNLVVFNLQMFDQVIKYSLNVIDASDRVNKFFSQKSEPATKLVLPQDDPLPVSIKNTTWSWSKSNKEDSQAFSLQDITLDAQRGSTVAIIGKVGAGKSSLLEAMLGNLDKKQGEAIIKGRFAYCSQEPWILSGTIQDNITFGLEYNESKMMETIRACGLIPDLNELSSGLKTMIGEKGINLSGGQKARVSLARAVYSDADVILLDCPLAALDAKVARKVFQKAILGLLKSKTVIMVSHNLALLDRVDQVVIMEDGRITEQGTFEELLQNESGYLYDRYQHKSEEESADQSIDLEEMEEELIIKMDSKDEKEGKEFPDKPKEGIIKKETSRIGSVKVLLY
jgi:ABC-type multidrug transport system fused ATPase/permease subunit